MTVRPAVVAIAALASAAIAQLGAWAVASADPGVPQPDTPCSSTVGNAMTRLADGRTILQCQEQPGAGYEWKRFTADYPSSSRWLTYGPGITLHGEGTRSSNIPSGDWLALPQTPDTACGAQQIVVLGAGVLGAPQTTNAAAGQPLSFTVLRNLFSITLTGYCLWTAKANSQ